MHLFYHPDLKGSTSLEGDEFHHCVKVLRHQLGDTIHLTDGKGLMAEVAIEHISKRHLEYRIVKQHSASPKPFSTHLFICPTKNFDRMEWMVEKAAEIQVDQITFMRSMNSERPKINLDRLEKKAVSALKQSKGCWKTQLNPIQPFEQVVKTCSGPAFLAFVEEKQQLLSNAIPSGTHIDLLIGPEGDFSHEEVALAKQQPIEIVSLGQSVLRTETAGLLACHTVNLVNGY